MTGVPLLNDLYLSILGKMETELGVSLSPWGKSVVRAVSKVLALFQWLVYVALGKSEANTNPATADRAALIRWGRVKIGRPPYAAIQGTYTVAVSGDVGAVLPANTVWVSDDTATSPGKRYVLDAPYTLTGTDDEVVLRALEGGLDSKLVAGDTLSLTQPIGLVNDAATVIDEVTTARNEEDIELYRAIVLASFRTMAGSWSAVDYRNIANNVSGVANSYAYAISGEPNKVNLYVECTTDIDAEGVPTGGILTEVETAVEAKRPLIVQQINYLPIVPQQIVVSIVDSVGLTVAQKTAIEAGLREALAGVRPYIPAADRLADRLDSISIGYVLPYCLNLPNVVAAAIPAVAFGAVTFTVDGLSVSSYSFEGGEIPYLDSVVYL
jgi:uncharacterized phage protein gp47/JayE